MALFAPRKLSRAVGASPMVREAQAAGFALAEIKEWEEVCRSGEPVTKIASSSLRDRPIPVAAILQRSLELKWIARLRGSRAII